MVLFVARYDVQPSGFCRTSDLTAAVRAVMSGRGSFRIWTALLVPGFGVNILILSLGDFPPAHGSGFRFPGNSAGTGTGCLDENAGQEENILLADMGVSGEKLSGSDPRKGLMSMPGKGSILRRKCIAFYS